MTFLNPLALLGLIAAFIPLIIHLLNLRKLKTIEFSTLSFLKELQQSKIRKLKLKQILLLVIRTLIIIFIVLAFSRPAFKGSIPGKIGHHATSTIVLILDDTFSMSAQDENGEYFKQAKELALSVIDLANVEDEIYIVKISEPESFDTIPVISKDLVKKVIAESRISEVYRPVDEAIGAVAKIMSKSINANKEVYLISDLQKKAFGQLIEASYPIFGQDVKFFVIDIGNKEISNNCVDSVEIKTKIFEVNKPVIINGVIKNYSSSSLTNLVSSLFIDGVRASQRSIDVAPWGSVSVEFNAVPKSSGFVSGYIELESDAIELDNRRYFSFYIPEKIRLLLISQGGDNSRYVNLALSTNSRFQFKEISFDRIFSENLSDYDVLIILGFANVTREKVLRIKNFVIAGGGLIVFPDDDSNLVWYNNFISEFSLQQVDGLLKASTGLSFDKIDFDHPIFSGVFIEDDKKREKTLSSPSIFISLKLRPTEKENQVITISGGYPFLKELKFGEGKVLTFSVAPNLSWSDFPIKGIFAPLIFRSVSYSAASDISTESKLTGENVQVKLPGKISSQQKLKLYYPDGVEEILKTQVTEPGSSWLNIGKLNRSGIYELSDGIKKIKLISVNTHNVESDLRKISREELVDLLGKLGIKSEKIEILTSTANIKATILQSRYGTELWKFALIFVLVLVLLEMLIAKDRKNT